MPHFSTSPSAIDLPGPFTHEWLHTRGLRLHAAVAGEPTNPLLLLLHSAFGGWYDYRNRIADFADSGYHVAALDLRGCGLSDKPVRRSGDALLLHAGDLKGAIHTLGHDSAEVISAGASTVITNTLRERSPHLVTRHTSAPWTGSKAAFVPTALYRHVPALFDQLWLRDLLRNQPEDATADHLRLRRDGTHITNALPYILELARIEARM